MMRLDDFTKAREAWGWVAGAVLGAVLITLNNARKRGAFHKLYQNWAHDNPHSVEQMRTDLVHAEHMTGPYAPPAIAEPTQSPDGAPLEEWVDVNTDD